MGVKAENIWSFLAGVHPNATAINSSGAATQDGSEFIAEYINNFIVGPWQALFDYASVTPNGITEAAGASQYLTAIEKGYAVGPGKGVLWWLNDDPGTTGDRVLLLQEQGVLIATYPELDAVLYVGDGNNATVHAGGGKFYRSSDSGGATPNIAGPYLQLPEGRGYALRGLDLAASIDPDGAARFLGDNQPDAFQGHTRNIEQTSSERFNSAVFTGAAGAGRDNVFSTSGSRPTAILADYIAEGSFGTPRVNSESRMSNLSIKFGITY